MNMVLVFTRTKHGADRVAKKLEQNGITTGTLHSNRSQNQRLRASKDSAPARSASSSPPTSPPAASTSTASRTSSISTFPCRAKTTSTASAAPDARQAIGDAISFIQRRRPQIPQATGEIHRLRHPPQARRRVRLQRRRRQKPRPRATPRTAQHAATQTESRSRPGRPRHHPPPPPPVESDLAVRIGLTRAASRSSSKKPAPRAPSGISSPRSDRSPRSRTAENAFPAGLQTSRPDRIPPSHQRTEGNQSRR